MNDGDGTPPAVLARQARSAAVDFSECCSHLRWRLALPHSLEVKRDGKGACSAEHML
jgi:hypothetical protein